MTQKELNLNKIVIEQLNTKEIPEGFWEKYHRFNEKNHKELFPNEPLPERATVEKRIIMDNPEYQWFRWYIYKDQSKEEMIASCSFGYNKEDSPAYEENKDNSYFSMVVASEYRRQGLGALLLQKVAEKMHAHGCKFIQTQTYFESGENFCKKFGGKLVNIDIENRLYLKDVDWDLVKSWVDEGHKRNPDVKIEAFSNYPERDIVELTQILTFLESETPILDEEGRWHEVITPESHRKYEQYWETRGYTFYNLIAREKDGAISGLTGISTSHTERPERIEQEMTGVLKQYRGRGLGKMLKARMLFFIKENLPNKRFISAGNADHNAAMLSINNRLGFKPHYRIASYNFYLSDLVTKGVN